MNPQSAHQSYTITFGGWYQRTTLHLTEVYDFFTRGASNLDLSKEKMALYYQRLDLKNVSREAESLECVRAKTGTGIEIRYYEDGLYVLELAAEEIEEGRHILKIRSIRPFLTSFLSVPQRQRSWPTSKQSIQWWWA